jgi:hypothetical protein
MNEMLTGAAKAVRMTLLRWWMMVSFRYYAELDVRKRVLAAHATIDLSTMEG